MKDHRIDGQCFDLLTNVVTSRRSALRAGGLGLAAATTAPLARVAAQESTPAATPVAYPEDPHPSADGATTDPDFLFVQNFQSGVWAPKQGQEGVYTLTLTGTSASTVYFSDRPYRLVGLAPTDQFLEGLGFTPLNPPNAALVIEGEAGVDEDVLVIELISPTLDSAAGTLTYDARVLADYDEIGLASLAQQQSDYDLRETFGEGSLFIDGCGSRHYYCNLGNQEIGVLPVSYCWNVSTFGCRPCKSPRNVCADRYSACRDSNGDPLCTTSRATDPS